MSAVAVFGASGHTGRFVVAELLRRAGPLLDTAHAVASAALRARIHYVEFTAEQASAQATLQNFDAAAVDAGVVVIPALGFYGGFLDLLASVSVGEWDCADEP